MRTAAAFLAILVAPSAWAQDQQIGARTKAMGGSYTAFEDDPVSVWLNPAGIATQPDALSLSYQTYTLYGFDADGTDVEAPAVMGWSDPALIPSYLGAVFQLGKGETDHAVGVCFAAPFRTRYPAISSTTVEFSKMEQAFYRFRVAYGHDFRLKATEVPGFLKHVSIGLAGDVSVSSWEFQEVFGFPFLTEQISISEHEVGFGGGAGVLLGLYDDQSSFKLNLGAAYQSQIRYPFFYSPKDIPFAHWPNQVNAGLTMYVLEGLPLRFTFDVQWINWDRATADSEVAGLDNFEDVFNYSIGAEYRINVREGIRLFLRAGVRLYQPPWKDTEELPAIGTQMLFIEPSDDRFLITSLGLGLAWQTEGAKQRMIDLAADYGGDAPGFAFSFTMEF